MGWSTSAHSTSTLELIQNLGYSTFVNCLDYTSAVLPVTLADKNIDLEDKEYKPISEADEKAHKSCKYC